MLNSNRSVLTFVKSLVISQRYFCCAFCKFLTLDALSFMAGLLFGYIHHAGLFFCHASLFCTVFEV